MNEYIGITAFLFFCLSYLIHFTNVRPTIQITLTFLLPSFMSTQPLLQRTAAKRIALPVRVEPKVSFANERTFLSWLHFTVVLGVCFSYLNFYILSSIGMCG